MAIKIQVKDGFETNTSGYGVFGVQPIANNGHVGTLMQQANVRRQQLNAALRIMAAINPALAARISAIGASCTGTAIKIAQIAVVDVQLATDITNLAENNLPAAVAIAMAGIANPAAARMQLPGGIAPAMHVAQGEVQDEGGRYRIQLAVQGASAEQVDVTVRNGKLIVKVKQPFNGQDVTGLKRSFVLGQDIAVEDIEAVVANGLLEVLVPKLDTTIGSLGAAQRCCTIA